MPPMRHNLSCQPFLPEIYLRVLTAMGWAVTKGEQELDCCLALPVRGS